MKKQIQKNNPPVKNPQQVIKQTVSKSDTKKSGSLIPDLFDQYFGKYAFPIAILLVVLVGFWAYSDYLFLKYLYYFKDIGSDSLNVDYPSLMQTEFMKKDEGRIFFWSFYQGMGYPSYSTIPNPLDVIGLLGSITSPILKMINGGNPALTRFHGIFFLFIYIGIVFYFYLSALDLSKYTRIMGTLIFSFLGFTVVGSGWGHEWDVFQGVTLLFAFEQMFRKNRWYFFPLAVMFVSGNLYYIYLYSVFLLIYSTLRFLDEKGWQPKQLLVLYGKMIGLGLLGIGINLINTLSSYETIINAPRVSGNSAYFKNIDKLPQSIDNGLQHATAILRMFNSDLLGNGSEYHGWYNYLEAPILYCGLVTLLLVTQVFVFLDKRRKMIYGGLLLFWILVVTFPALRKTILLYVGDYYKRGINLFFTSTLLFLGMYALSQIDKLKKINIPILVGTLVFLLILLFFPYSPTDLSYLYKPPFEIQKGLRIGVASFLILESVLLVLLTQPSLRFPVQIALLLTVAVEVGYFTSQTVGKRVAYEAEDFKLHAGGFNDETMKAVELLKSKDKGFYRMDKDYASGTSMHSSLNDAQAQGYFGTANYSSFNQGNYVRFLEELDLIVKGDESRSRWAPGVKGHPLLEAWASVKYYVLKNSRNPYLFDSISQIQNVLVAKTKFYVPFGFAYDKCISFSDFSKIQPGKQPSTKEVTLLRSCVVEDIDFPEISKQLTQYQLVDTGTYSFETFGADVNLLKKDTLLMTSFSHDKIVGKVKLDKPKMMFFTIPYDKGWKVTANGKELKTYLTNVGFIGVLVEKGETELVLDYLPDKFNLSLIITSVALLIFAGLFFAFADMKLKHKFLTLGLIAVLYLINLI